VEVEVEVGVDVVGIMTVAPVGMVAVLVAALFCFQLHLVRSLCIQWAPQGKRVLQGIMVQPVGVVGFLDLIIRQVLPLGLDRFTVLGAQVLVVVEREVLTVPRVVVREEGMEF